jgi:hypothetical protein
MSRRRRRNPNNTALYLGVGAAVLGVVYLMSKSSSAPVAGTVPAAAAPAPSGGGVNWGGVATAAGGVVSGLVNGSGSSDSSGDGTDF